jgi:arylsulfatase A-like enzyme
LIKPGTMISKLTQNIDFAPTFLDFAGIDVPDDMQGVSFRNLFKEEIPMKWRNALYYHYYEFPGFHSVRKHYGIRTDRYKLIHFHEDNHWELFDLENDSLEINNIYGRQDAQDIIKELKQELRRLQTIYKVPEGHISDKKD